MKKFDRDRKIFLAGGTHNKLIGVLFRFFLWACLLLPPIPTGKEEVVSLYGAAGSFSLILAATHYRHIAATLSRA